LPHHCPVDFGQRLSLVPLFSHFGGNIDPDLRFGSPRRIVTTATMGTAFEEVENAIGNEAAADRQNMSIAKPMLTGTEVPEWL
jgi:hypothetical protein